MPRIRSPCERVQHARLRGHCNVADKVIGPAPWPRSQGNFAVFRQFFGECSPLLRWVFDGCSTDVQRVFKRVPFHHPFQTMLKQFAPCQTVFASPGVRGRKQMGGRGRVRAAVAPRVDEPLHDNNHVPRSAPGYPQISRQQPYIQIVKERASTLAWLPTWVPLALPVPPRLPRCARHCVTPHS